MSSCHLRALDWLFVLLNEVCWRYLVWALIFYCLHGWSALSVGFTVEAGRLQTVSMSRVLLLSMAGTDVWSESIYSRPLFLGSYCSRFHF
jgi:hypothetical protein